MIQTLKGIVRPTTIH